MCVSFEKTITNYISKESLLRRYFLIEFIISATFSLETTRSQKPLKQLSALIVYHGGKSEIAAWCY